MTTESDAVLATIVDNWGGGGYGGATPKIQSTADISVDRWAALDAVIVLHDTLDERHPPLNDKYVDKEFTIDIRVTSITSEDQLKLLVEEVEYLLNNTAITGFTSCRIIRKWRGSSDRKRKVYRNDITIELWTRVSSSAIAPDGGTFAGPTTLSSLVFSDGGSTVDIILDEDDMASDDVDALATQQSIKAYIDAANMRGSANAVYVPCPIIGFNNSSYVRQQAAKTSNVGADDVALDLLVPIPTNKGGLKLYLKNFQFGSIDADANDYVGDVNIYGLNGGAAPTLLDNDTTNHTSTGTKVFSGAVMPASPIDCSGYGSVIVFIACVNTDALQMDLSDFLMECYYAT